MISDKEAKEMVQERILELRSGYETACIDAAVASNLAYKPQFISNNYKRAYHYHSEGKSEIEKLYLRLLLVTDYICGMTDSYAKRLYQELNAIV